MEYNGDEIKVMWDGDVIKEVIIGKIHFVLGLPDIHATKDVFLIQHGGEPPVVKNTIDEAREEAARRARKTAMKDLLRLQKPIKEGENLKLKELVNNYAELVTSSCRDDKTNQKMDEIASKMAQEMRQRGLMK